MIDVGDVTVGFLAFDIAPVIIKLWSVKTRTATNGKENQIWIISLKQKILRSDTEQPPLSIRSIFMCQRAKFMVCSAETEQANHSNENDVAACSPNGWNGTLVGINYKSYIPFYSKVGSIIETPGFYSKTGMQNFSLNCRGASGG